jgi:butyryl-CoA dehydrogenase
MNFELSEEHAMVREAARDFAEQAVAPIAAEIDQTGEFPRECFGQAGQLGFAGVAVPEELGGAGMDTLAYAIVIEEISRACANMGVILSVNNSLVCDPILKFGTAEQKERFLVPLARGELLGCFALTEPEAGSDAANQKTRAVRDGGVYRLQGEKIFITCGGAADVAIVFAATDREKKHRGISAFLVETGSRGFDRSRHQVKLGVNASGTVEIFLNDVEVPSENLLGAEGEGFKIAMATLDGGRIGIAAQAVGIARSAFEAARRYARERKVFGHPIADFQALRFYLADMATEIEAARLLTWRAASRKDETAKTGGRFTEEAAIAKLYAAEMAQRVSTKALQIHGGYGYTKEFPVERNFRDARITEIYEGTSEIQRVVIAREIFGK